MNFKRIILSFTVLLVVFTLMGSSKKEISMEETIDAISGTWINEEYVTSIIDDKLVIESNGTIAFYLLMNKSNPNIIADLRIEDTWIDPNDNIWVKAVVEPRGFSPYFCLFRISDSGKILEYMYSSINYPERIVSEPEDITTTYLIYYRQE
jgi:hypothetical protein